MIIQKYKITTEIQASIQIAIELDTRMDKPEVNKDGSVDLYFGAKRPKGNEKNWVPTNPKKGFFVVFRFYGPTEGYINKTWTLNDFKLPN